jgi:hypothetical protein
MLQFGAAPVVTSNPFSVNGKWSGVVNRCFTDVVGIAARRRRHWLSADNSERSTGFSYDAPEGGQQSAARWSASAKRTFVSRPRSAKCHVWTAPAVQEESDISAKRSGAAMYPAFECSRYGRWP